MNPDELLQARLQRARSEDTFEAWLDAAFAFRRSGEPLEEAVAPLVSGQPPYLDVDTLVWIDELHDLTFGGVAKGDRVFLANKRARPKFKESGERVPHLTKGRVRWSGANNFGESVLVECEDGQVFFTNPANLQGLGFEMSLLRDEVRDHIDKHFPKQHERGWVSYPNRLKGRSVRHKDGKVGEIFWAKWQGHEIRVGFKIGNGEPTWASIVECVPA